MYDCLAELGIVVEMEGGYGCRVREYGEVAWGQIERTPEEEL